MSSTLHCALEAHTSAATIYLRGTLSTTGTLLALRCCEELPDSVRTLRIDLHGVEYVQPSALHSLALVLRGWRERRGGITRVELPAPAAVALRLMG